MEKNSMVGRAKARAKELEQEQRKKVVKSYDGQLRKLGMSASNRGVFWNKKGKMISRAEAKKIPKKDQNPTMSEDGMKMNIALGVVIASLTAVSIGVIAYLVGSKPDELVDIINETAGADIATFDESTNTLVIDNPDNKYELDMSQFLGEQDPETAPSTMTEDLGNNWTAEYTFNYATNQYEVEVTNPDSGKTFR